MFNVLSELCTRAQASLFVVGPEHGMSTQELALTEAEGDASTPFAYQCTSAPLSYEFLLAGDRHLF